MRNFRVNVVPIILALSVVMASWSVFTTSQYQHRKDVRDSGQDRVQEALIAKNTQLTQCLSRLAVQITTTTALRSEASERRDESLVGWVTALGIVLKGRVIDGIETSPEIRQAADQFLIQIDKFLTASGELDKARVQNPPPEFKDFCPKVPGTGVAKTPKDKSAQE